MPKPEEGELVWAASEGRRVPARHTHIHTELWVPVPLFTRQKIRTVHSLGPTMRVIHNCARACAERTGQACCECVVKVCSTCAAVLCECVCVIVYPLTWPDTADESRMTLAE